MLVSCVRYPNCELCYCNFLGLLILGCCRVDRQEPQHECVRIVEGHIWNNCFWQAMWRTMQSISYDWGAFECLCSPLTARSFLQSSWSTSPCIFFLFKTWYIKSFCFAFFMSTLLCWLIFRSLHLSRVLSLCLLGSSTQQGVLASCILRGLFWPFVFFLLVILCTAANVFPVLSYNMLWCLSCLYIR